MHSIDYTYRSSNKCRICLHDLSLACFILRKFQVKKEYWDGVLCSLHIALQWDVYLMPDFTFVVSFLFCCGVFNFILLWVLYFILTILFCCRFFILVWVSPFAISFSFSCEFSFCCQFLLVLWVFYVVVGFCFVVSFLFCCTLFYFAVSFCISCEFFNFILPRVHFCCCRFLLFLKQLCPPKISLKLGQNEINIKIFEKLMFFYLLEIFLYLVKFL